MIQCRYCGETFEAPSELGFVPTHDFPKPCRSVCCGSGEHPREPSDAPLGKDIVRWLVETSAKQAKKCGSDPLGDRA